MSRLISLQVIWRKASQPNPITVGELTYVADERFKLHHIPDKGEWNLFIKNIQHSDAGMYECQISSKEKYIRKLIQVNVIGKIVSKFSIYTGLIDVERVDMILYIIEFMKRVNEKQKIAMLAEHFINFSQLFN